MDTHEELAAALERLVCAQSDYRDAVDGILDYTGQLSRDDYVRDEAARLDEASREFAAAVRRASPCYCECGGLG